MAVGMFVFEVPQHLYFHASENIEEILAYVQAVSLIMRSHWALLGPPKAFSQAFTKASENRSLQDEDSLTAWECLLDFQGVQSQKEGQEDQRILKQLGGAPHSLLTSLWSSWPCFWL